MPIFTRNFDLERYIALLGEADKLETRWQATRDYRAYYAGDQETYLTPRQREYLGPLITEADHGCGFNVCKPVVDTLRERCKLRGYTGSDAAGKALAAKLADWLERAHMDAQQITVHRRALRDGVGYVVVGWDAEDKRPTWTPNRAYDGDVGVTYHSDPETGAPVLACKYWRVSDPLSEQHRQRRRTVYLPDRILRFKEDAAGQYGWTPLEPREGLAVQWWTDTMQEGGQPLGVACIEFPNPGHVSELADIMGPQNALNKTYLDLQAAADATGFQIITISYPGPAGAAPVDDEDATDDDLSIAPGRALELFDGATAGTLPPGDLAQLIQTLHTNVAVVAAISRTPQYYLWPYGGSDVPSGEALKQLESALEARATERTKLWGPAWVTAARIGARLYRAMGYTDVEPEAGLHAEWDAVSVRNEFIQGQVAEIHQRLGIPQEVLWVRQLGYSQEDAEQFKALLLEAQRAQVATTAQALREGRESESADMQGVVAQYEQAARAIGRLS